VKGQKLSDHIVIGTPGTLLDWCTRFRMIDLRRVNVFVLDEADVMIDTQGHQDQSIRIQRSAAQLRYLHACNMVTVVLVVFLMCLIALVSQMTRSKVIFDSYKFFHFQSCLLRHSQCELANDD